MQTQISSLQKNWKHQNDMLTNMEQKIKTHQGSCHTQNIQTCNDENRNSKHQDYKT